MRGHGGGGERDGKGTSKSYTQLQNLLLSPPEIDFYFWKNAETLLIARALFPRSLPSFYSAHAFLRICTPNPKTTTRRREMTKNLTLLASGCAPEKEAKKCSRTSRDSWGDGEDSAEREKASSDRRRHPSERDPLRLIAGESVLS